VTPPLSFPPTFCFKNRENLKKERRALRGSLIGDKLWLKGKKEFRK